MRKAIIAANFLVLLLGLSCQDNGAAKSAETAAIVKTATAYAQALKTRLAAAPPTATATTVPKPTPYPMIVANTGGLGVFIRRTPSMADRIKAWVDGTVMMVTGKEADGEGRKWLRAQDPDGNVGWIPAEYLALPKTTP